MTMAKKKNPSDISKICAIFTLKQIDAIEKVLAEGRWGNKRSEVVKNLVMKYLIDKHHLED